MKLKQFITFFSLFTFALASPSWAALDMAQLTDLVERLQKTVVKLENTVSTQNEKIRRLEDREPAVHVSAAPISGGADAQMTEEKFNAKLGTALGGAEKWLKDMKQSGDVRLRYEAFLQKSGNPSETDPRNRFRMRLRYGVEKKLPQDFTVGFGLATGEVAGTGNDSGLQVDPTSTNQTFDNLFNLKDIWVDKAYAIYTPAWALALPIIKKVTLGGGKVANPFEKGSSDMIWDRDTRPEGAYEKVDLKVFENSDVSVSAYALAGQFILDEDSSAVNHVDAELFAWQTGFDAAANVAGFDQPVGWSSAFSYYTYPDYPENGNFLIGATSLARGNSNFDVNANELDQTYFNVIEFYNELKLYVYGVPVNPFFDVAHNAGARTSTQDDETWAWSFGAKLGGIAKKGDWELSYAYKRIEVDSVVGAFTDSDFGLGHAGKAGSQLKLGYGLTDNLTLNGAAWFVDNLNSGTGGVQDERQSRFQADLIWKF